MVKDLTLDRFYYTFILKFGLNKIRKNVLKTIKEENQMADRNKTKPEKKGFTVTTYAECRTGGGQLVGIKCRPKDVERAEEYLKMIHSVHIPETSAVGIGYGGYGKLTKFIVNQHKYAGSGWPGCGGFIEVLEIKNPPQGRCGIVIHEENSGRSTFHKFGSLNEALKAWEKFWSLSSTEDLAKEKGFIRRVNCGLLEPWFYAVGNQAINGDFAFPDYLDHNHPVYRTGRKVRLVRYDGEEKIKTCWGTTIRKYESYDGGEEKKYLEIQFDDGTTWSEYGGTETILPLNEENLLKEKILDGVRKLLNGKMDRIVVISEGKKLTIESVETNKPIGYYFTGGVQQMINEAEKQIEEITFIIQSEEGKAVIGGKKFSVEEKDIEDPLLTRGDDYYVDEIEEEI